MVGRTVVPTRWSLVKITSNVVVLRVGGEHLDVLLIRPAEADLDELAHIESQAVSAVRCRLDSLLAGTGCHLLYDAEVVVRKRRVAGLPYPSETMKSYVFSALSGSICAIPMYFKGMSIRCRGLSRAFSAGSSWNGRSSMAARWPIQRSNP